MLYARRPNAVDRCEAVSLAIWALGMAAVPVLWWRVLERPALLWMEGNWPPLAIDWLNFSSYMTNLLPLVVLTPFIALLTLLCLLVKFPSPE